MFLLTVKYKEMDMNNSVKCQKCTQYIQIGNICGNLENVDAEFVFYTFKAHDFTHLLKLFESWTLSRRIHCYVPKTGFTAYREKELDYFSCTWYSVCSCVCTACVSVCICAVYVPDGCEAEVCMSHMDPVSGTDIDLFIEGIILCSLHLEHTAKPNTEI